MMDQGERPNLSRRGFLGLLAGAMAMPIIKPKKSYFFFDVERKIYLPEEKTFDIQAAIDALAPMGGTLFVPEGTYLIGQSIFMPSNVTLKSEGPLNVMDCDIRVDSKRKDGAMIGNRDAAIVVGENSLITGCRFQGVGEGHLACIQISL